jgi:hypothetical protein
MSAMLGVRPWRGRVYRHIPGASPFGPLETRFAIRSQEGHWHRAGEPTLSFASDRDLLIAEYARHFERHRAPELTGLVQTRQIFELELKLERVVDLSDPAVVARLGIANAPACFLDRSVARATAGFLRDAIGVEAILAPSAASPERPDARNLMLFLDRLESPLSEVVRQITPSGSFQLVPSSPPADENPAHAAS